jgi:putative sterol carrier protein
VADPTADFFGALAQREHEPLLEKASGTVRVDITDTDPPDHWFVVIDKGELSVSRSDVDADCVIQANKEAFDRIASGEANAMAMVLRGAVAISGSAELMVLFQRLFPGPPAQREQPVTAGYARRQ